MNSLGAPQTSRQFRTAADRPTDETRIRITSVAPADLDSRLLVGFGLDAPLGGHSTDEYAIDITGWVVGRRKTVKEVEIDCGIEVIRSSEVWLPRGDVAARLAAEIEPGSKFRKWWRSIIGSGRKRWLAEAKTCGFQSSISVVGLAETFSLNVTAILSGGERVYLGTLQGFHQPIRSHWKGQFQPLILSGLGRSGSSWLIHLLGEHPDIVSHLRYPFISRVAIHLVRLFQVQAMPSNPVRTIEMDATTKQIASIGPLPLHCRTEDPRAQKWICREFVERLARFSQEAIEEFYSQVAESEGKFQARYFAEKAFLYPRLGSIFSELYPEGREIFLVRDFRDVACSRLKFHSRRTHQAQKTFLDHVHNTADRANNLLGQWQARRGRAHLVRYEDLVLRTESTLAELFAYLGVENDSETVARVVEDCARRTPELDRHRTVGKAHETIGRWRRDLTAKDAALCESLFGPALREFGYVDPS